MLDGATGCRGLIAFHSTSPDGVTPMPPAPITLADLFQTGAGLIGPAWMPVYDLAAYLTAADQATGWSSDMMAARSWTGCGLPSTRPSSIYAQHSSRQGLMAAAITSASIRRTPA